MDQHGHHEVQIMFVMTTPTKSSALYVMYEHSKLKYTIGKVYNIFSIISSV